MVISKAAHATTLLTILWLFPSTVVSVFFAQSLHQQDDDADFWVAVTIWTIQLCFAGAAAYVWKIERTQKITVIKS